MGGVELHLLQGLSEKDVELASTVDGDLVELGAHDHWLQDEWEPSWFREACQLIRVGEGNGTSDHRRGVGTAGSMLMTSQRVAF
jgi:hypothetical protein